MIYLELLLFLLQKIWYFFTHFLQNLELWPHGVSATCSPRTIWHCGVEKYHLKYSQLKRFGLKPIIDFGGVRKTIFFASGVGSRNNHLHLWISLLSFRMRRYWTWSSRRSFGADHVLWQPKTRGQSHIWIPNHRHARPAGALCVCAWASRPVPKRKNFF